jgi:hypothetical protein
MLGFAHNFSERLFHIRHAFTGNELLGASTPTNSKITLDFFSETFILVCIFGFHWVVQHQGALTLAILTNGQLFVMVEVQNKYT